MPKSDGAVAESLGLPPTPFLYTLDQICTLVGVELQTGLRTMFYYVNRSTGDKSPHSMTARNISSDNQAPDWRVAQNEFVRWLKLKGFRIHTGFRIVS